MALAASAGTASSVPSSDESPERVPAASTMSSHSKAPTQSSLSTFATAQSSGTSPPSSAGKLRGSVMKMGPSDKQKSSPSTDAPAIEAMSEAGRKNREAWDITVSERSMANKGTKRPLALGVTLSITTSDRSLTLNRSVSQIAELDAALREEVDAEQLPPALDLTSFLSSSRVARRSLKRSVLATISRTLSPVKQRHTSTPALGSQGNGESSSLQELASYLERLASISSVQQLQAWRAFFVVDGPEDIVIERSHRQESEKHRSASAESNVMAREGGNEMEVDGQNLSNRSALLDNVRADVALSTTREAKSLDPTGNVQAPLQNKAEDPAQSEFPSECTDDSSTTGTIESEDDSFRASDESRPGRVSIGDFDFLRVLGKGCAGKVLLVRHKGDKKTYALKSVLKKHVLDHRELHHTMTEQAILAKLSAVRQPNGKYGHPFISRLHWSFRDELHLYLCLDFYPGGDLATQLARWGVLGRDRARFYSCEMAVGLETLHKAGIVYRDLKPENVLIGADGHICLADFGLSKELGRGNKEDTATFCGTAEYLAPEVLLGHRYGYPVDWYSYGTMLFEMLYGRTPFYADNHREMYRKIVEPSEKLVFPDFQAGSPYLTDETTRNFIRGLLNRDPMLRISDQRVRNQPYFSMIRWEFVETRRYRPPFIPDTNPANDEDTSNFDKTYLEMEPTLSRSTRDSRSGRGSAGEGSDDGKDSPVSPFDVNGKDVFDGYSFCRPESPARINQSEGAAVQASEESVSPSKSSSAPSAISQREEGSEIRQDPEPELAASADSSRPENDTSKQAASSATTANPLAKHRPSVPTLNTVIESGSTEELKASEDDWHVIESARYIGDDVNGLKGRPRSLFARGIVDRYRMQLSSGSRSRHTSPHKSSSTVLKGRRSQHKIHHDSSRSSSNLSAHSNSDAIDASASDSPTSTLPKALHRPAMTGRTSSAIGLAILRGGRSRQSTYDSGARSAGGSRAQSGAPSINSNANTPPSASPPLQTSELRSDDMTRTTDLTEVTEEPVDMLKADDPAVSRLDKCVNGQSPTKSSSSKRLSRVGILFGTPSRRSKT